MTKHPVADDLDDMPAEVDFSHGVVGLHSRPNPCEPIVVHIEHPDGTIEERILPYRPRPDIDAVSPDSLRGTIADTLSYIYNPHNDVLSVRLTDTWSEAAALSDEDQGFRLLTSEESGKIIGMVVYGYLQRWNFLAPLVPVPSENGVNRDLLERSLEPLRDLLPAA
ncbi:MAG: hypothetical protein HYU66_19180 [Armatimonadetes bacterium]|nr:hypothetical protein [Armatimonadota bacterium]